MNGAGQVVQPPGSGLSYPGFVNFTELGEGDGGGRRRAERARCAWCRRPLPDRAATGRPRRFCKEVCRQLAYQARRRAAELRLGEDELVLARRQLDELRDGLYVLQCAVDDVDRDLGERSTPTRAELQEALAWVLEAARTVVALEV